MGPTTLLCPSSSGVHLRASALPPKILKSKEESNATFLKGSFRSTCDPAPRRCFLMYSASSSERSKSFFTVCAVSAVSEVSTVAIAVEGSEESVLLETSPSRGEVSYDAEKSQPRRSLSRNNSKIIKKKAILVENADLVEGAVFSGKVISVQPFGAFVDIGAFTDGLVHISRLSRNFVRKIDDFVQVGQDIEVKVLDVDFESNRISLMRIEEGQSTDAEEANQDKETLKEIRSEKKKRTSLMGSSKRAPAQKRMTQSTTLKKGETVTGTVKNIIKSGVFVSLPDGTDGYLPTGQVIFKSSNTNLETQFQVGEEVTVTVLRIQQGRANLTMKKEVDYDKINEDLNKGVIEMATSPFELAFRGNEWIAKYLSDRDKLKAGAVENLIRNAEDVVGDEVGLSDANKEASTSVQVTESVSHE
ncbi:hypothetical protein KP509_12G003500 [Ceratopteris richardii]|uniref:S1 motif domain-containing protein n=1 Tax=Ceratopteris richardii TaxID=49495 RepID=A0A8T2TI65_CERRI|nr:hypothetical protein KP509_12G003500 [Ceratopteris richardii]KAH7422322.1 hypothetical protein KP509_12G003500 [Ceratopteris richardii]